MCQSLMLTANATPGQRSAPGRLRSDAALLKINASLSRWRLQFPSPRVASCWSIATFVFFQRKGGVKCVLMFSDRIMKTFKFRKSKKKIQSKNQTADAPPSSGSLVTWLMRRKQFWWWEPCCSSEGQQLAARPDVPTFCHDGDEPALAQSLLAERSSPAHRALFHVAIKTACGLQYFD